MTMPADVATMLPNSGEYRRWTSRYWDHEGVVEVLVTPGAVRGEFLVLEPEAHKGDTLHWWELEESEVDVLVFMKAEILGQKVKAGWPRGTEERNQREVDRINARLKELGEP